MFGFDLLFLNAKLEAKSTVHRDVQHCIGQGLRLGAKILHTNLYSVQCKPCILRYTHQVLFYGNVESWVESRSLSIRFYSETLMGSNTG